LLEIDELKYEKLLSKEKAKMLNLDNENLKDKCNSLSAENKILSQCFIF